MTNPFTAYVGLRGLDADKTVWVNDLPGISTELVNALRKDDQSSAQTWARIGELALSRLQSLLETELNKSGEFQHTLAQSSVWSVKPAPATVGPTSRLQGVRVQVPYAPFRQVVIDGLTVLINGTGNVEVPISLIDLQAGVLLETVTVTRAAAYRGGTALQPIAVDVPMYGLDLFVGINPTGLTLTEMGGAARPMTGSCGATMVCGSQAQSNPVASGFEPSDCLAWFGLSVGHSLPAVVAKHASALADCYRHIAGSLLLDDKCGSTRINLYTSTNLEFTREKVDKFMADAIVLLKPIARRILNDLSHVPGPVITADPDTQPGVYVGSML